MALENNLIFGTQDWQHPEWRDTYYTDECPTEWQFAYYSSLHRSVWVPASFWQQPLVAMQQFVEDSDEGFYFVFELADNWQLAVNKTLDILAEIKPQIACLILPVRAEGMDESKLKVAQEFAKQYALALDVSCGHEHLADMKQLAKQENWSIVCYADQHVPVDSGEFLAVVTTAKDLRQLKGVIQQAACWMATTRNAGVYISPHTQSPMVAQQGRELAEIMAVA